MKFLSIYKTVETNTPPSQEHVAQMGQLIEDMMKAGTLVATEGCLPSSKGARVRLSGGTITVTDGPFIESKEVLGGYWLVEAASKEELVKWAQRCPADEGDVIEIRQIFDEADFAIKK